MRNFLTNLKSEIKQLPQTPLTALFQNARGSFVKGYHLEFVLEEKAAIDLCDFFAVNEIFAHRGGAGRGAAPQRVYIKDSESLCNLLLLLGATKSLFKLNNEIALRSVVNVSNRRANCDTHNLARQIETAIGQLEIITNLINSPNFKSLAPELQQTAHARIENPTASYDELAKLLHITKSGLTHRLQKLTK